MIVGIYNMISGDELPREIILEDAEKWFYMSRSFKLKSGEF